jgi:hypothetical protein
MGRASAPYDPSIVFRESRCPGCHKKFSLMYLRTKEGDSYRFKLLSPPIHPMCSAALERMREDDLRWFKEEINAKAEVSEAPKVHRRKKPQGQL